MTKETKDVKVTKAKGRPMLTWVGKKPLSHVKAYPAQRIESFSVSAPTDALADCDWSDWPDKFPRGGLLFHGDNKDVLAYLLANGVRGKVKLIYIDPPFDSGADYVRRVHLRGGNNTQKMDANEYSIGEQVQYTDIWANDNYLQFMYERLLLCRSLLMKEGSFWLHCDSSRGHYLKILCDEIFGSEYFVNQVVWKRSDAHSDTGQGARHFGSVHDMILIYKMSADSTWNDIYTDLPESTADKWYRHIEPRTGRRFNKADVTGPGGAAKGNPIYEWKGVTKAWRYSKERMEQLEREGRLVYSKSGMVYQKRYLDESKGIPLQDWWDDIPMLRGIQRRSVASYPTEKPINLINRIVEVATNPNDLVLDCFVGSGTTAESSQRMGRRWIGCDLNKGAIQTTARRLHAVIQEQAKTASEPEQGELTEGKNVRQKPCQLGLTTWRVNDYDLQIQHNEAVELVSEYMGITRTRTDSYFDGTLGSNLVKTVPFNHPLTPLDLEDLKTELSRRPEEERNITLVSLGMELAAKKAIEDHNRNRPINKIDVIELRTDKRYGGIIRHEPMSASVDIQRKGEKVIIEVNDVFSPIILQRLDMQEGMFRAKIEDWRAVVDCIMIDTDYDGEVLDVALSDIPARKQDLVEGRYEIPAPPKGATVAVKIIDMLGEETLVTKEI